MKGAPPPVSENVVAIYSAFQAVIQDRQFRASLDALSADVLDQCAMFFDEHQALILQHLPDADPAYVISALVGWILGMPAGREHNQDKRSNCAFQHNALAAYVSAWSAENSARVHGRDQH